MAKMASQEAKALLSADDQAAASFHAGNPDFDLLNFDFHEKGANAALPAEARDPDLRSTLETQQRLMRITDEAEVAAGLKAVGFESAHAIAMLPEHRFIRETLPLFKGNDEAAREVHARARSIRAASKHLVANLRTTVASPHFAAMAANNVSTNFAYFEDMPSYQSLFGSLNYCNCKHCASIFGPAAYFLDMMRITDDYITDPNTTKPSGNIPDGYRLDQRRPDLFELSLNCSNTDDPVPTLTIVNQVLERVIASAQEQDKGTAQAATASSVTLAASASGNDNAYAGMWILITAGTGLGQLRTISGYAGATKVANVTAAWSTQPDTTSSYLVAVNPYQTLAAAPYPFNLPENLPLIETRHYLAALNTTLPMIYKGLTAPLAFGMAQSGTATTLVLAESASSTDGAYNTMILKLIDGTGAGQARSITAYAGSTRTATVEQPWVTTPDDATEYNIVDDLPARRETAGLSIEQYQVVTTQLSTNQEIAPYYGVDSIDLTTIARVDVFLERTGLTWDQLQDLLTQNLSKAELTSGLADLFFVNATGESLPAMQIAVNDSNPDTPYFEISDLSLDRLDRLNRFIRLSASLGWTYEAVDWTMKSVGSDKIDEATIKAMAGVQKLVEETELDIITLTSFWAPMKTIGKGDLKVPADLFDRVFNPPALLKGQDPYTSVEPIPFDPTRPLQWDVSSTSAANTSIRGRLLGALNIGDDDLTLIALTVVAVTKAENGTVDLTLDNLTLFYRLTKTARVLGMTVDSYLVLLRLVYDIPGGSFNFPMPTVDSVLLQLAQARWFNASQFSVYSALYVMTGEVSPYYTPVYRPDGVAPFVQNLATLSEPARLAADDFVFGDIDAENADKIYNKLVYEHFITDIGIVQSAAEQYHAAAAQFPLTAASFVTGNIPLAEATQVFAALQASRPPILIPADQSTALLARYVVPQTPLDFLFPGQEDAPNRRNEVMAVLMTAKADILFTELAAVMPISATDFVSKSIVPKQSVIAFNMLAQQTNPVVVADPAAGQSGTVASYTGATRTAKMAADWTVDPGPASIYAVMRAVTTGTAQSGTLTTIVLAATASAETDAYAGMTIRLTGGTGANQTASIVSYDGASKTATIEPAWVTLPDATSEYSVTALVTTGVARSASPDTIVLDEAASGSDNAYDGMTIEIVLSGVMTTNFSEDTSLEFLFASQGAGQSASISDYVGESRTATVSAAWSTVPNDTSSYQVISTVNTGALQSGTVSTVVLAESASSDDGAYDGMAITVTQASSGTLNGVIFAYDGTSKTATLQAPWSAAPAVGDSYVITEVIAAGTARGGGPTTILLDASASSVDDAYNAMTLAIVTDPNAVDKQGSVMQDLLKTQQVIAHARAVIGAADAQQQGNAIQGLADFLGTTADRLATLIPLATSAADLEDYLGDLLTPIEKGQVPSTLPPFIAALARSVVLFDTLEFSIPQILAVIEVPQAFAVGDTTSINLGDLTSLSGFKDLVARFGGQSEALINYLRRPADTTPDGPAAVALSELTHWPVAQIAQLETLFWADGTLATATHGPGTVPGLMRLDRAFGLCNLTGFDTNSLLQINALGTLPLVTTGTVNAANWQTYTDRAGITMAAVKAKFGDPEFISVNATLTDGLNEARRDMLLGYSIWLLQQTYPNITTPERLYQFLLIDVEMSGCDDTSYIAQAIASIQLYMQRCRLMLEPGVTDLSNIPQKWWSWIAVYRVWEANRKIFLYPENYLNPGQRTGQTPQFAELVDALMQTDINKTSVANAYVAYFEGFSAVAQLTNATAYGARLPQHGTSTVYAQGTATAATSNTITLAANSSRVYNAYFGMIIKITGGTGQGQVNSITIYDGYGTVTVAVPWKTVPDTTSTYVITGQKTVDTLFLVGNTNTEPPVFYWRKNESTKGWTPWAEIKQSIAATYVSPVYAFDRLNLLWVEQKLVEGSQISSSGGNATSNNITDISAEIKYSFIGKDNNWIAPQSIEKNIIITYEMNYDLISYVKSALANYSPYLDPSYIFWMKTYPIHIKERNLTSPASYPQGERIVINYGLGTNVQYGAVIPLPTAPSKQMPKNQYQLENTAFDWVDRNNAIANAPIQNASSILQVQDSPSLDGSMTRTQIDVAMINGLTGLTAQPYFPLLNRSAGHLNTAYNANYNLLEADYTSDNYPGMADFEPAADPVTLLNKITGPSASVVTVKNIPGSFLFDNGDETFLASSSDKGILPISEVMTSTTSYPPFPDNGEFYVQTQSFTTTSPPPALADLKFSFDRMTTTVARTLNSRLMLGGIDSLLTLESQLTPEPPFSRLGPTGNVTPPPTDRLDFSGAYGLYFWEIFYYAPFLVADMLLANQRFAEAKDWLEYIFNPTQQPEGDSGTDADRYWRFLPFRDMTIESLTQILTNPEQITAYNDDPFDPDAIARLRTSAYAKATVMKYVSNIIGWADNLFRQDTRESINQATNLYVLAWDLLGPRPIETGECATPAPLSYNDIKQQYNNQTISTGTARDGGANTIQLAASEPKISDAYDGYYIAITAGTGNGQTAYVTAYAGSTQTATVDVAWTVAPNSTSTYRVFANGIPQFLIRLENTPIIGLATQTQVGLSDVPFNDIDSYFCVPENSELIGLWDLIDDRLYKIRHCMNIAGQVRKLALFSPPIDPRALIQAARSGASTLSYSSQFQNPIPYYRFSALIDRAKGLTSAVTQLGASLLSALEKQDGEALAQLRTGQENALLKLATLIKEQQIVEVEQTGAALQDSLDSAEKRQSYYTEQIQNGLSDNEIQNIVYMTLAAFFNTMAGATRTMASIGYAVPQVGSPFAMTYGGKQLGAALSAASGVLEGLGVLSTFGAQLNQTMAQYRRRESEWQLQTDLAGFDVAQIGKQIEANTARKTIAERDMKMHESSIAQNEEIAAFLKDKFTDEELYQWMATRLSVLYYQTYTLATELARSVQRAYQYELDVDTSFINFGYWEGGRRGLLAGEGLMLALNQMEKSYLDSNSRPLEIEKSISLLQLNPKALLDLVATGECVFELPEKMFDDDFPGHYARKIVNVAISIPAIVGPYQNIHATLTQLSNQVIFKPDVNATAYLLGEESATVPEADVMRNNWWSNQQIALSQGLSDTGLFEATTRDERYLPFEGTGAVSTWRLSMPKASNLFDFQSITDVVVQLRYTAKDGGTKFHQDVIGLPVMRRRTGSDFFACAQRFSTQWYQFIEQPNSAVTQTLSVTLEDLVPTHVDRGVLTGVLIQLDTPPEINPSAGTPYITLTLGSTRPVSFAPDRDGRFAHFFTATPRMSEVEGAATIEFDLSKTPSALKLAPAGTLDPAALQNIVVTLFYDGEVNWK